ncbi:TMEM175 family protein [Enteractinococcus coprophilus]
MYQRETSSFDRVLGFLDAIYAFAVTLLVLNIDVTSPEAWSSIEAFFTQGIGSQLLGFLISFLVIVAFWRRNHAMLANFTGLDPTTITWNIVVAGLIIFIPFTTQGISDPHTDDLPLPTAVYAVNIALAVMAHAMMLQIAARRGLLIKPLNRKQLRARAINSLGAPIVFLVSIPVAYLTDGNTAKFCWLALLILGPLGDRLVGHADTRFQGQPSTPKAPE